MIMSNVVDLAVRRAANQREVLDLGFEFHPVPPIALTNHLRTIASDERRKQALTMRQVMRDGRLFGNVYLVGEDPEAFRAADGVCYLRKR
jgi:hypothetical protein